MIWYEGVLEEDLVDISMTIFKNGTLLCGVYNGTRTT